MKTDRSGGYQPSENLRGLPPGAELTDKDYSKKATEMFPDVMSLEGANVKSVERLLCDLQDELHYKQYPSDNPKPIYKEESLKGDYFPLHMVKTVCDRKFIEFQSRISELEAENARLREALPKWVEASKKLPDDPSESYMIMMYNKNKEGGIPIIDMAGWDGENWNHCNSWENVIKWMPLDYFHSALQPTDTRKESEGKGE